MTRTNSFKPTSACKTNGLTVCLHTLLWFQYRHSQGLCPEASGTGGAESSAGHYSGGAKYDKQERTRSRNVGIDAHYGLALFADHVRLRQTARSTAGLLEQTEAEKSRRFGGPN